MEKGTECLTAVTFSKDHLEKAEIDMKVDESSILLNIGEEKNNITERPVKQTTLQIVSTYTMCFLISLIIGFSFTSYGLIVGHSLKNYSVGFFDEYHNLFKHLCPAVLYLGSTIGTVAGGQTVSSDMTPSSPDLKHIL